MTVQCRKTAIPLIFWYKRKGDWKSYPVKSENIFSGFLGGKGSVQTVDGKLRWGTGVKIFTLQKSQCFFRVLCPIWLCFLFVLRHLWILKIDRVLRLSPKPDPTVRLFIKPTACFLSGMALRIKSHFNLLFLEDFSWRVENSSIFLLCDSFICSLEEDEQ